MTFLKRHSKFFARLGWACLALVFLLFVTDRLIDWICLPSPPNFQEKNLPELVTAPDGQLYCGKSWMTRRDGIWQMYLEGDPFLIGYTCARLTNGVMKDFEDDFIGVMKEKIPSAVLRRLLREYIVIRMRHLPDFVAEENKLEILGISRGFTDHHPEIGPIYDRLLDYHAAHDVSHFILDLLPSSVAWNGCTAFAAWGAQTANGHLLAGRNFDFDGGEDFDKDKIVIFFKPEKGYGFLSVAWPGMMGVVSGMNEKHLYVTINAGSSRDNRDVGTPSCFVARQVLQYASSIDEAVSMIGQSQMFVSDSFLIADGKTGKAVVVEKSPRRMGVRQASGNWLVCANHYFTPVLAQDPKNLSYMKNSSTLNRQRRMEELVAAAAGRMSVFNAAKMLRDRGGDQENAGGGFDPKAINPLIATHSVIGDVTEGILWVSQGPHQLGAYVPFGVERFGEPTGQPLIPADPFLLDGRYKQYLQKSAPVTAGKVQ
jgi:hypothetical protein